MILGVALLAIVAGVAYISRCAYRNAGDAMPDQPAALAQFRATYGRLCVLTAKALKQPHPKARVEEAARGEGNEVAPVYVLLRSQRKRTKTCVEKCVADGVTLDEIATMCLEIRALVESEWMLELPFFAEMK